MKTIGISMVGSGFMGKLHTLSIGSYPIYYYPSDVQPRLECIVGHTPQAAQEGMKQFGFRRAATDWRTLLTDEKTDVIVIATPNDLHRQIAIEAIRSEDAYACALLDRHAYRFSVGLSNVIALLDPEVLAIGGGVALLGEPLLSRLRTQTERLVYGIYRGSYRIETAKLQEDAVPLGVLRLLAEETEALQ